MSDLLSRVQTGIVDRPISVLVHGGPGCGKSTFAAGSPDPVFIDADNRSAHLNVRRYIPSSWDDVLDGFRLAAKGELKCGTLVVDTLDQVELLLWKDLAAKHNVETIEDVGGGWQKGYVAALAEWRRLCAAIDAVRARGINTVLVAHSQVKTFQNPAGENYDRWEVQLDKRAHKLLTARVDGVGFAAFDTVIVKSKEGKAKAKSSGIARLSFAPSAACETKRFARFPESCELSWSAFTGAGK